jgi:hypothetical protein
MRNDFGGGGPCILNLKTVHMSQPFESAMDCPLKTNKVTVLLDCADFERLDRYCEKFAFKKSTLIARLVSEHLDREGHVPSMQAGPARHVRGGA